MSRKEFNLKLLEELKKRPEFEMIIGYLPELIEKYPDQRFGQLFCNYIFPEYRYRSYLMSIFKFMDEIFPGNPDPFFEESSETYNRYVSK
jgi:hypothetical protein